MAAAPVLAKTVAILGAGNVQSISCLLFCVRKQRNSGCSLIFFLRRRGGSDALRLFSNDIDTISIKQKQGMPQKLITF